MADDLKKNGAPEDTSESGKPIDPIPLAIGTAVTGGCRFPRPGLEHEFDALMASTNGTKVFGLRRIGKSSEALACRARLAKANPGWVVVELDVQGYTSEAKLLLDILAALPNKKLLQRVTAAITADNTIAQAARDFIQKATGSQAEIQAYFGPIMQAIEREIQANDSLVLVIDEFPWLCRNILESDTKDGKRRVDVLLAAFRRWRGKGVRMMLIGSIGMAALCRMHGLDSNHLNDLKPLDVPPLSRSEAELLVDALVRGNGTDGWTNEHTAQLIDECSALYPAMVQDAFLHLTFGKRAVQLGRIGDIFADKVRPDQDGIYFAQFDRRMQLYRKLEAPLPEVLPLLLEVVMRAPGQAKTYDELRKTVDAAVSENDLGDALTILREDGFFSMSAPKGASHLWKAASPLVKAWWNQRRGGGS